MIDPASAMLLFLLFQATEKVIGYAGGKIADSMTKPIWEALEEKAKWITGKSDTTKRWEAFSQAFAEARIKLESEGRHPEVSKQIVKVLGKFDTTDPGDKDWMSDLSLQLEKASLVSEKPDEYLLVELFYKTLSRQITQPARAELSETVADFVSIFQNALFAQPAYQELMLKRAWWEKLQKPRYDTRERYIAQVVDQNENLDFVGIPELKDRQALRIEDVFISLQTQIEVRTDSIDELINKETAKYIQRREERNAIPHLADEKKKSTRRLSANQALTENQKIVILGDPGAGKTTLLKYIVLAFAENKANKIGLTETRLPIFIRLYDYVAKRGECGKDGFSFTDYLTKFCADHLQLHLPPDFFEQALERGECCVCFDGLDELGAAGLRREVTSAVSAFANRYPRNRFLVTSRSVGYEEAPLDRNDFTHHTVLPLGDEDIKLFVEKWYKARERDVVIRRERTEHLTKTIMDEPRIKSLAANPLMLTIIALVHRVEAELPHERVKLYDKCVTTLVETWDKVRGMKTNLRRRLLEKLAYWMHSQPGEKGRTREVREGNLRLQLLRFLQDDPKLQLDEEQMQKEVEDFITLVKTRSGLLVERGEDVYTFSHLTFQEYLASCDIEKRLAHSTDAIWAEIQPKLNNAHWHEVILLLLGSLNRFEEHNSVLMRKIYETTDIYEPVFHRHLFLVAEAMVDRVEINIDLYNRIVSDLTHLVTSSEFAGDNLYEILFQLKGNPQSCDELLMFAKGESVDGYWRFYAARVLRAWGQKGEGEKILLEIFEDPDEDVRVRSYAIISLNQREKEKEVAGLLLALAEETNSTDIYFLMATWLIDLGLSDEAIPVLKKTVIDLNTGWWERRRLLDKLVELGRLEDAGESLLVIVKNEQIALTDRELVISGLRYSDTKGVLDKWLLLIVKNAELHPRLRVEAVQSLSDENQKEEASRLLIETALDMQVDISTRDTMIRGLGGLGHSTKILLESLFAIAIDIKYDVSNRQSAVVALAELIEKNEIWLKKLLSIAMDENMDVLVRCATMRALGNLGFEGEIRKHLYSIVGDETQNTAGRIMAASILIQTNKADKDLLNKMLINFRYDVLHKDLRGPIAFVLGYLGRVDEACELFIDIVVDEKMHIWERINAVKRLAQLKQDEDVARLLISIAKDDIVHSGYESELVEILISLGRGVGLVLELLHENTPDNNMYGQLYLASAKALGKMGQYREAVRLMMEFPEISWPDVESLLLELLVHVDEKTLLELLSFVQDEKENKTIRYGVFRALRSFLS